MSKLKLRLRRGSLMLLVAAMSTAHSARAAGAELTAETLKAWTAYIQVTEHGHQDCRAGAPEFSKRTREAGRPRPRLSLAVELLLEI